MTDLLHRRHRFRLASLVAASLVLVAVAAGCSASASGDSKVDLSSVTLRIGDQQGTGAQALLQAAGLLKKLPFTVSWSNFTSGPPMLQAMGSGSVDIGGVGNAPPAFAASGGEQIAIVGARTTRPGSAALLVPKDSPITSIQQLKGRKIAVAQGSSADYHLLTVLAKAGLSVKDVTTENLQPADALSAFASGHVDAWDVWSPYVEQAVAQDNARVLVNGQGFGSNYSFEVAAKDAINDAGKAAAIRKYLTVLDEAYTWAAHNPAAWAKVWAKATGLPQNVMVTAAKDAINTPIPITKPVIASEQKLADSFYKAGLVPAKVDFSDYTVTTFNDTVAAAAKAGGTS
jgi:sulfonate transport system substrate-binding protein